MKHIDPSAFRDLGFLQEANRLFFHPHGLALELTCVTEAAVGVSFTPAQYERVLALMRNECHGDDKDAAALVERLEEAVTYAVGDRYFSGCWDFSDDPEGVIFGSDVPDKTAKAERVAEARERYRPARTALFGETDVEPIDWVLPADDEQG